MSQLKKRGTNPRTLALAHKLAPSSVYLAVEKPNYLGEMVISKAIGLPPADIWPSRYDATGNRIVNTFVRNIKADYNAVARESHVKNATDGHHD